MLSFFLALVLGTFTDLLANRFLGYRIPSLAPVVIMIPATTILYSIHKYGLMLQRKKKSEYGKGVILSFDDFGTEYSSLSRLKDVPVDRLKIDMQFIQRIGLSSKDESIIAVMIHLAKRLGSRLLPKGWKPRIRFGFSKTKAVMKSRDITTISHCPGMKSRKIES